MGDRVAREAVREIAHAEHGAPFLTGHVTMAWDAMGEWFAEDEQLFGHPRDPYSRIDVLSRRSGRGSPAHGAARRRSAGSWADAAELNRRRP